MFSRRKNGVPSPILLRAKRNAGSSSGLRQLRCRASALDPQGEGGKWLRALAATACVALASAGFAFAAETSGQANIPNFSLTNDGWIAINSDFTPVPGEGPKPVTYDRKFPFRRNDEPGPATYRVADTTN